MASITRSKSGSWTARKGIPKDVRDDYERLYGYRWEAKLTLPATLRPHQAKAEMAEWVADVERRIDAIRASQRSERQALSQKQVRALAGEWYKAFTAQHDENPGSTERWDEKFWLLMGRVEDYAPDHLIREDKKRLDWILSNQGVRDGIRPAMAKEAKVDQFLADRGLSLSQETYNSFVDCVLHEYAAGVLHLERRANGYYGPDHHLEELPHTHWRP